MTAVVVLRTVLILEDGEDGLSCCLLPSRIHGSLI